MYIVDGFEFATQEEAKRAEKEKAGIRYVFFIAAFFILLCDRVRKNNLWFFWWWILLCITGIFYNVSIGASVAVAFLPEAIYRLIKEIIKKAIDIIT